MSSFNIGGIKVTIKPESIVEVDYSKLTNGSVLNLVRMVERETVRNPDKIAKILQEALKRGLIETTATELDVETTPEPTPEPALAE